MSEFATTAGREDLDWALFGVTVSQVDQHGNEVGRYFQKDGLFAGGRGEPTISGVLAFPEVGVLRCADPVLWEHPRFAGAFPASLGGLEARSAPVTGAQVRVGQARSVDPLEGLGLVAED